MRTILFLLFSLLIFSTLNAQPFTNVLIDNTQDNVPGYGLSYPEEPSIYINPKNSNQIVAGANIRKYYYSTNSGINWTTNILLDNTSGVWGDPCMSFDTAGNSFFLHLANPSSSGHWIDRIVCARSTNGGVTYGNPGPYMGLNWPTNQAQQDKEWNAVDWTHGPRGNWMYVTWTEFDVYGTSNPADSSRIVFSRSTNGGLNWSNPPVRINGLSGNCLDGDNTMEGAVPTVGPNGELYVGWSGPRVWNSQYGIYFQKSMDGGNTWLPTPIYVCDQPGGWDYNISGIDRCNGLPITCCDVSNGPYRGNIYINWTDEASSTDHDVKMIKSTNGGLNWSTVKRVNDDPAGKEQFFTWMCIDQSTGYLYFVFYDRRNYSNTSTDVYMARSTDGGNTFTNFMVSSTPFTPSASIFFGDYTNVSAVNGHVRPIWTRGDQMNLSVWTALIEFPVAVKNENNSVPKSYSLSQNYPNPFNPSTTIKFNIPSGHAKDNVIIRVFDILGKEVSTLVNEKGMSAGTYEITWHASNLSSGIYFYSIKAGNFSNTKKMILAK